MPRFNEKEFLSHLKQGVSASLFVFFGPDEYSKEICVNKLLSHSTSSAVTFDGDNLNMQNFHEECCSVSFFESEKCVILRNPNMESLNSSDTEIFYEILSQKPDSTTLIIVAKGFELNLKKSPKWAKLVKHAEENGIAIECAAKTESDAITMINNIARKNGCSIDRELARDLSERCLNDMLLIESNLLKLCSYACEKTAGVITLDALDNLTARQFDSKTYEITRQLINKKPQNALSILNSLFLQQIEPISICAALSSTFIDIYRVKLMQEYEHPQSDLSSVFDYKGKEYKLRSAGYDAPKCSLDFLKNAILALEKADILMKSAKDDRKVILERTLINIIFEK